jgi:hypothetical protein
MMSFTVKLKKILVAVVVAALVVGLGVWVYSLIFSSPDVTGVTAPTTEQRLDFLKSLGWDAKDECADSVDVPEQFDEVFSHYNSLQTECGFDLSNFKGKTLKRFIYTISNHPDQKNGDVVKAELLLNDQDEIVGGSIYSLRLDGFMTGLCKRK